MKKSKIIEIYDSLFAQIDNGEYAVGDSFPSLTELMLKFSASRPTVCKALKLLEEKKMIYCIRGVGTIVADPKSNYNHPSQSIEIGIDCFVGHSSGYIDYTMAIVRGISKAAEIYGFKARALTMPDIEQWSSLKNHPNGLILMTIEESMLETGFDARFRDTNTAVIVINRDASLNPFIGEISVDYYEEAKRAISLFIRSGSRRIVAFRAYENGVLQKRVDGWRDAFLDNDLPVPEELCIHAKDNDEATKKLGELLDRETPDVIFISNGSLFYPAYTEMCKRQLSPSKDVQLLCFDDIAHILDTNFIAANYIRMPLEDMGFMAAENIYKKLTQANDIELLNKKITTELIIR